MKINQYRVTATELLDSYEPSSPTLREELTEGLIEALSDYTTEISFELVGQVDDYNDDDYDDEELETP